MILTFLSNFFIFISVLGYSYIFKKFLFPKKNSDLVLIDILYGFLFLIFISIFFNFFIALENLSHIIFVFGILFFIKCFFNKLIKINF